MGLFNMKTLAELEDMIQSRRVVLENNFAQTAEYKHAMQDLMILLLLKEVLY